MRAVLVSLLALVLTACGTAQKLDAANDVHALLIAIRDNDSQTFDSHVDHEALKGQLRTYLNENISANKQLKGLASLLGPSAVDFADETLVQPKTFRLVAEQYGYKAGARIPDPFVIAKAMKTMPDGRVCATKSKDGPCMLVFAKEGGIWKLTSFQGDFSTLKIKLGRF